MPTYEYLCQTCSHRFETWQKMTAEPLTTCPECGGHIRRVLYPTGIIFKGSGFYKTDYGHNGSQPASNGDAKKAGETTETHSENGSKPSENGTGTKAATSGDNSSNKPSSAASSSSRTAAS